MTFAKKKKKLLLIFIPVTVVMISAAVVMAVLLLRPQPQGPHLVQAYEDESNPMFILVDGYEDEDFHSPLPFYGLQVPQGWTHSLNAEETANSFSSRYRDYYITEDGTEVTFTQDYALNNQQLTALGTFQMVPFGDLEVVCYQSETDEFGGSDPNSGAFWIYGESLLKLTCNRVLDTDEMMELVGLVDYETQREPIYSPLRVVTRSNYTKYTMEGNPQVPEDPDWYFFTQTPEGYHLTYVHVDEETSGRYMESGRSAICTYENEQGDQIQLENLTYANALFMDNAIGGLDETDCKEEITVNGVQGYIHTGKYNSEIAWLVNDYCYVVIRCTAPLSGNLPTREGLLDLAATVSQDAPPPVVETE